MLTARVVWNHGPLTLNEHLGTDGTVDGTKVKDTIVLDRVVPQEQFRSVAEAYHLATGGALGRVHKGMAVWRLQGRILVPDATQEASLSDRRRAVAAAFDPALCLRDAPDDDGAYALDFYERTLDTSTWPTGWIPLRVYARPLGMPVLAESVDDFGALGFFTDLLLPDPRTYAQAWSSLVLTPGAPSGLVTNLGTAPAPLGVTIAMAGAGATNFTITRGGVSFVLDLSSCVAGQSVVVVMETAGPFGRGRLITKAGTEAFSLKTSAASTWLDIPTGGTTFAITNTSGVTSCTLAWRDCWA